MHIYSPLAIESYNISYACFNTVNLIYTRQAAPTAEILSSDSAELRWDAMEEDRERQGAGLSDGKENVGGIQG